MAEDVCTNSCSAAAFSNPVSPCSAYLAVFSSNWNHLHRQISLFDEPAQHPTFGVLFPTEVVVQLTNRDSGRACNDLDGFVGLRPQFQH